MKIWMSYDTSLNVTLNCHMTMTFKKKKKKLWHKFFHPLFNEILMKGVSCDNFIYQRLVVRSFEYQGLKWDSLLNWGIKTGNNPKTRASLRNTVKIKLQTQHPNP